MSKIWFLLFLVGAVQFVKALPAFEEDIAGQDLIELLDWDLSDEERGATADWFKGKWEGLKNVFIKVSEKVRKCFNNGRELLHKKGIKVELLECANNTCKSCVNFELEKKTFCIKCIFTEGNIQVSITKQKDEEEPEVVIGPYDLASKISTSCHYLSIWTGPVCLKGVEGVITSREGRAYVDMCACVLFKRFSFGFKGCVLLQNGRFSIKFKPKVFAGDEDEGQILEAGDKEDEGKVVDPVPE